MTTTRPPQRRGLGRGLGSLIPTGPAPAHRYDAAGAGVAVEEEPRSGPPPEPSVADQAAVPDGGHDADWIGRLGAVPSTDVLAPALPTPTAPAGGPPTAPATELQPVDGAFFAELPPASISPNPRQPRQVFDEEAMAELVHSIREVGLLQPVVVRPTGLGRYELVMGERRWRAAQLAEMESIPAIVRETNDDALLRDALLENLHRSQLNPLEEAAAYQQLLDDFGCTHEELAQRIGRSRPQISNTLRLLRLSPPVQRRVAAGVLSAGHARALLSVTETHAQDELAARVVAEGISVRGLEEIVAVGDHRARAARDRGPRAESPGVDHLVDRLSDVLETRVRITLGRAKGRITVDFATLGDLERIVSAIDPGYQAPSSE